MTLGTIVKQHLWARPTVRIGWGLAGALAIALALGPTAGTALAKSYFFERVDVAARVERDGALLVTETRAYRFSGSFAWATYTLEREGWTDVTGIIVADETGPYALATSETPRTYSVDLSAERLSLKWHFRAEDESKTFTIRYRITGVVTRYQDTAELYWRFVGTGWDAPSSVVHVAARIPGAKREDLRAWGHGPLNGVVALGDGEVTLDVESLDAGTMVEGRILFPARLVPGARVKDEPAMARILREEAGHARRANRVRLTPWLNIALFPVSIFAGLAAWLALYMRYGKEHRIRLDQTYLREPPASYRPAVLGALLRWGKPNRDDFAATILDLARRGVITIERLPGDRGEHGFTREDTPDADLADSERQALALLFRWGSGGRKSITDHHFRQSVRRNTEASGMFERWRAAAQIEGRRYGFFDEESQQIHDRVSAIYHWATAAGIVLSILVTVMLGIFLLAGFVAIPLGAGLMMLLRGPLVRRTVEGATDLAQWRAFRRFLTDFSALQDAPPPAITVWESYLPYAVSLGVARQVIRQFPSVYGTEAPPAPRWYAATVGSGSRMGGGGVIDVASLGRSLSRTMAMAATPRSSSRGSGGGFSSRSGGGGGGGGGGGSGGSAG
jgi:uncharacterized membrane protein